MSVRIDGVVAALLASDEPSVVLATRRDVLNEPSSSLGELRERVRDSRRAKALIAGVPPGPVYNKWHGAHWVLADLADLGHPPGVLELTGLRDRVLDHWLRPEYYSEYETKSRAGAYGKQ